MAEAKKSHRWYWVSAVLIGVPVLYLVLFGPACWITERTGMGTKALSAVYQPMLRLWSKDTFLKPSISWYAEMGTKHGNPAISRNRADGWLTISWHEKILADPP